MTRFSIWLGLCVILPPNPSKRSFSNAHLGYSSIMELFWWESRIGLPSLFWSFLSLDVHRWTSISWSLISKTGLQSSHDETFATFFCDPLKAFGKSSWILFYFPFQSMLWLMACLVKFKLSYFFVTVLSQNDAVITFYLFLK